MSPGIIELILLLLDLPVNFLADLAKLKLSSEDLVFFLFKGSLSLFQSRLEFFLLLEENVVSSKNSMPKFCFSSFARRHIDRLKVVMMMEGGRTLLNRKGSAPLQHQQQQQV